MCPAGVLAGQTMSTCPSRAMGMAPKAYSEWDRVVGLWSAGESGWCGDEGTESGGGGPGGNGVARKSLQVSSAVVLDRSGDAAFRRFCLPGAAHSLGIDMPYLHDRDAHGARQHRMGRRRQHPATERGGHREQNMQLDKGREWHSRQYSIRDMVCQKVPGCLPG